MCYLTEFSHQSYEKGTVLIPILQVGTCSQRDDNNGLTVTQLVNPELEAHALNHQVLRILPLFSTNLKP